MRKVARVGLAAGLLVTLAAGCSSGSSPETTSRPPAQTSETRGDRNGGGSAAASAKTAGPGTQLVAIPASPGRDVVRTGTLTVATADVPGAVARATATVTGAGGYVETQQADIDPGNIRRDQATLTLKVPGPSYDSVLPALRRLGTLQASEDKRIDVTGDVVDASTRIATEEASVARVRTLLTRAQTIGEVVSVESELTKREASLASLKGRLAALKSQVSYATITLHLVKSMVKKPTDASPAGFLAGIRAGWGAFAAVAVGVLTALGAALPFAVTLLGLAGLGWAVRRRILRRPAAAR